MGIGYTYGKVIHILGKIEPVGETNEDKLRLHNLQSRLDIMYMLVDDIMDVAAYKDRPEASMSTLGNGADKGLRELVEYIEGYLERNDWRDQFR